MRNLFRASKIRFLIFSLWLGILTPLQAIEVSIPNSEQPAGKTFELPIQVGDLTGQNVTQVQFTVMFNPSVLTGVGISQETTRIAAWPLPVKNISEGAFGVTASGATALTGSGTLIKLIFTVQSQAAVGTSIPLVFTNFKFNSGNPAAELTNGVFLVIQDIDVPLITGGPTVEKVTANSATIFWVTNEPTNGRVEYGRSLNLELSKSTSSFVTEHRISLTDLAPAQNYYFRVSSSDRAGNGPVSSKTKSFFTSNIITNLGTVSGDPGREVLIPLNISDISGLGVIGFAVDIKFDPTVLRFSRVVTDRTLSATWRLPQYSLNNGIIHIVAQGGPVLTGSGSIANLLFQANPTARAGKNSPLVLEKALLNNGLIQVTTENGTFSVRDTQPPEFVGSPFVEKITPATVLIRWQTNERTTSLLRCGENSHEFDIQKTSNVLTTDHWLELTGLKPETDYSFQISTTDSSGNGPVIADLQTFRTAAAGRLLADLPDLTISKGTRFQLPLNFQNGDNSKITQWFCAIKFDPSVLQFLDISTESTLVRGWPRPAVEALGDLLIIHALGDSALKGSGALLRLNFQVASDVMTNKTELEIKYFIVNTGFPLVPTGNSELHLSNVADPEPPKLTFGPISDNLAGTKATVFWMTNKPATSEVQYGAQASYGQSVQSLTLKTEHQLTMTSLWPYNKYHFRVLSAAITGSTPTISADVAFATTSGQEVRLTSPDFRLAPGSIFQLPVKIDAVLGRNVKQVEFTLNYDPELALAGTAATSGTVAESWGSPIFSTEAGKIRVQLAGSTALPDSGILVKIQFEVLQKSAFGKVTPLYFSNVKINQGALESASHLGLLQVVDGTLPLITRQPQAEILTPGSAVITWRTDEPTTSIIEFGTSTAYGQELRSDLLEQAHVVQLTNLEPNTLYYYRVGGVDEYSNGPIMTSRKVLQTPNRASFILSLPDFNYALNQAFWLPVTVHGASADNPIYAADFTLKFDAGVLKYQQATGVGALSRDWEIEVDQLTDSTLAVHLAGNSAISGEGSLVLMQFLPYNSRRFGERTPLVLSNAKMNDSPEGVNLLNGNFTLLQNAYPVITFGPGVSKVSKNSLQIYWITNQPTQSKIEYGLTENYEYTLSNNNYVKYHAIDLFGLKSDTKYHFKVSSTDAVGHPPAVSADVVFSTGKGTEVAVSLPDTSLTLGKTFSIPILVVKTDEKNLQQVTFEVEFDSNLVSPGGLAKEGTLCENWEMQITRLTPSLIAGTVSGGTALSGSGHLIKILGVANAQAEPGTASPALLKKISFNYGLILGAGTNGSISLIDQNAPQFTQLPQARRTFPTSAILTWETDEPTSAIVEFGADSVIDVKTTISKLATRHEMTLTQLYSETVYACRVGINDSRGNGLRWSPIFYFETKAEPIRLSIPEMTLELDQLLHVPVRLSGVQGTAIRAFSFELHFNGSRLVPVSVNHANSLIKDWAAPAFSTGLEDIKVSASGKNQVAEDGTLLWLSFKAYPHALPGDQGWLTFSRVQINEDIDSTGTDTTWFTLAPAVPDDSVTVTLPDTTLEPGAWCLYPIRLSAVGARAIFKGTLEIEYAASVLSCGGAFHAGKMLSAETPLTNYFGTNRLRVAFEASDQLSGSGTLLRILFRIRPDAPLGSQVPIRLKTFSLNNGEIPLKLDSGSFTFFHYNDVVMGYVVERDSLNPVIKARVELIGENNQVRRTSETDWIGRFVFKQLNISQQDSYRVKVSKTGYSNVDSIAGVVAGSHQLRRVLLKPDGKISGKITTPTGFPVHGAEVIASDSKGNEPAHSATTTSDAEGLFQLEGLNRVEPFRLVVQKTGFKQFILNGLYADTSVWCVPDAFYSSLSGTVNLPNAQPVANALVTITDVGTQTIFDSLRTDAAGRFGLKNLVAGSYLISPVKAGFLAAAATQTLEVGPGQNYSLALQMEQGILDHFEISGKDLLPNNARTLYRFNAWATAGEKMELPAEPHWRVNPPVAGNFENSRFFPNPSYFCDAWIVLETADNIHQDSLRINLFAPISPESDIELKDYQGFSVDVLPGSVAADTIIYVSRGALPEIQNDHNLWKVTGTVYDLQPHALYFQQPLSLQFPLQSETDSLDVRLGHWDFQQGQWRILPNVIFSDQTTLTTPIEQSGVYAQLAPSQELGIFDIQLTPNPFSPEIDTDGDGEPGLAIHFIVSSTASNRPFLTLKIYNLLGELVRGLMLREPVEKVQEIVLRWDGLTDHQLQARNGRYLLRLILEDASGKKEYLKKIVLVK
jgi:hypothetical protein